jgi:hypothetical protein
MNNILRIASTVALLAGAGTLVQGCLVGDCKDSQGNKKDNCVTLEPLTGYNGTDVTDTLTYTAGLDIVITNQNGDIDVEGGAPDGQVLVTFSPFTAGGSEPADEAEAKREMEEDLILTSEDATEIHVAAESVDGANGYLGAHIEVKLPAGFDSSVFVESHNGGVQVELMSGTPTDTTVHVNNGTLEVAGAGGKLDIGQNNGTECHVEIASWAPVGDDGIIQCSWLDSTVVFPSGIDGSIQVESTDGVITDPSPLPADWTASAENVDNAKSFSFGMGTTAGANVRIANSGDIALDVQ